LALCDCEPKPPRIANAKALRRYHFARPVVCYDDEPDENESQGNGHWGYLRPGRTIRIHFNRSLCMTTKSLLCAAVLTLVSFAAASAKTYDIVLDNPVKAGAVQLKPGAYIVKVKGDSAIFTSVSSGKSFTAPVKLGSDGSKHDATTVRTTTEDGAEVLKSIRLGGSNTTLEFNE